LSRMGEKPDSIGGKRWLGEKKAKPYGKVLYTLFLPRPCSMASRKNVVWHGTMEGK